MLGRCTQWDTAGLNTGPLLFMVALCNRETIYIFMLFLSSSFFSSPNLSGRRFDVYHTLAHGEEMMRLGVDICGLSEVRLDGHDTDFTTLDGHTIVYSGRPNQGMSGVAV